MSQELDQPCAVCRMPLPRSALEDGYQTHATCDRVANPRYPRRNYGPPVPRPY